MTQEEVIAQQDRQRTARAFISFLSTVTGADQSYAGSDGYAVNAPRQYTVIGANGEAVEGGTRAGTGGVVIGAPLLLMLGVGVVLYLALKK